ncbi:MAG: methionyl-tRNA formyltransferase [Porticoccaceae bacterium]|nr:MAG: methionyl-tRNA formyltransferase [Porticoccaceae bacterium]
MALADLRIAFAGTPPFAAAHLRALLAAGARVVAAYTQPDRPAGRGRRLAESPVKALARAAGVPVRQPESLRDPAAVAQFAELAADVFVVVAYGLILPPSILALPRLGCVNVHASLLPRWRGAAPIPRAIAAGDRESGITVMQMDEGLDTGPILRQAAVPIDPDETAGSLHDKLLAVGPPLLVAVLEELARGRVRPVPQDHARATYAPKVAPAEAALDWRRPAGELARQVRAFDPVPGCHTRLGSLRLKIWRARPLSDGGAPPGTILAAGPEGIAVACGAGALLVEELQLPGRTRLAAAEVVRGRPALFAPGNRFEQPD